MSEALIALSKPIPHMQARTNASLTLELPSPLITFVIGWMPCTLASCIGVLAVIQDAPRQALFDLLLWLAYGLAACPFAWILRSVWRANVRFGVAVPLLLLTSFLLAMLVSLPQYDLAIRLGLIRPAPLWPALLIRMQGCWFLLIIFAALYWVPKGTPPQVIWLRTTLHSDRDQIRRVSVGWLREIWVFANGEPVFSGKNLYNVKGERRSPDGRLSLDNDGFDLSLHKGENEIVVAVDDNTPDMRGFYGWGFVMRVGPLDRGVEK